ncbi:MAG: TetR/AcrR family transcriptional regulator [Clostridiales bacterium]|nr:TetR/AcrR family transcriptional regulator [Clostridiales bacterium]
MTATDGETRNKLLKAARKEFIAKGYMNASLRTICKDAGVTTGALYFFFKDKDELFAEVVKEPLLSIRQALGEHLEYEEREYSEGYDEETSEGPDVEVSRKIVEIMFKYKDECVLLLTKSSGSSLEFAKDSFIERLESSYRVTTDKIAEARDCRKVDDYTLHYLTHMQVESFIYLLTHSKDINEALAEMPYIVKHMRGGWFAVMEM